MNCPICNNHTHKLNITHKTIKKANIFKCDKCDYQFVDCTKYTPKDIYKHQFDNSHKFGNNIKRNIYYLKRLQSLKDKLKINKVLEIGTPKNHDFLSRIHKQFGDSIKIYSYDVIDNVLPAYIHFYKDKNELIKQNIDVLFCIHTLEHIPSNELLEFVNFCKTISKNLIFEVPLCETNDRILESSTNPHYSFFTRKSIKKLFGETNIVFEVDNKVLRFNSI